MHLEMTLFVVERSFKVADFTVYKVVYPMQSFACHKVRLQGLYFQIQNKKLHNLMYDMSIAIAFNEIYKSKVMIFQAIY